MKPILYYMLPIITFVALTTSCGPAEFTSVDAEDVAQRAQDGENPPPLNPPPVVGTDPNDPVVQARYSCGGKKLYICHVPEGNPGNRHTLCLPPPAIEAHLREHDATGAVGDEDHMGPCL